MADVATAAPLALSQTLATRADDIRSVWLDAAARELHGRTSRGELEREQAEIFDALVDGLRAGGTVVTDAA